jgi:hypothetical protein
MSIKLDSFTRGYLEAALWTSDFEPGSGEWSEREGEWSIDMIAPESLARAIEVCKDFQDDNREDLDATGASDNRNGVDFWLTRNGHGAGFWDRGYDVGVGNRLSVAAKAYGSADVMGPETNDQGGCDDAAFDAWDGIIYIYD